MAVTYAQFIARIPGKRFSGLSQALVDSALTAATAEVSSDAGTRKDELVHWLTAHKLWLQSSEALTDVSAQGRGRVRDAPYLHEYRRLARVVFAGPRVF